MARLRQHGRIDTRIEADVAAAHHFAWAVHGALACLFAGLAVFAALDPDAFREAMQEDALAEWATFWVFAAAGIGALCTAFWRANASSPSGATAPNVVVLVGLGLFCLFVAGEEISWGQRFFGFRPPAFFLESNYQQELNLHNLFMEVVKTRVLVAIVALGYGVLLPLATRVRWKVRFWPHRWVRAAAPSPGLVPWFTLVALAELVYPVSYAGEAAELALGAVFLADVWFRAMNIPAVRRMSSSVAIVTMALALLVLSRGTMVVGGVVAAAGDEALVERAEADLDHLSDDLAIGDAIQPSLLRSNGAHYRVFTAVQKGHLRFPAGGAFLGQRAGDTSSEPSAARHNRQEYFLDPWHNSYWLFYHKRAGVILLYSLGPNRRRDTPINTLLPAELRSGAMSGDDIGIVIDLAPGG